MGLTEAVRSGEGCCSVGLRGLRTIADLTTEGLLFFALTIPLLRDEALCMRCLDMADILRSGNDVLRSM